MRPRIQTELMDRLCQAVGRPDDSVALVTCGTLGVEVAIGLARNIARGRGGRRRGDILTSSLSYHGMRALTLAGRSTSSDAPESSQSNQPPYGRSARSGPARRARPTLALPHVGPGVGAGAGLSVSAGQAETQVRVSLIASLLRRASARSMSMRLAMAHR